MALSSVDVFSILVTLSACAIPFLALGLQRHERETTAALQREVSERRCASERRAWSSLARRYELALEAMPAGDEVQWRLQGRLDGVRVEVLGPVPGGEVATVRAALERPLPPGTRIAPKAAGVRPGRRLYDPVIDAHAYIEGRYIKALRERLVRDAVRPWLLALVHRHPGAWVDPSAVRVHCPIGVGAAGLRDVERLGVAIEDAAGLAQALSVERGCP